MDKFNSIGSSYFEGKLLFVLGFFGPIGVMTIAIFYWITSLIMGILSGVIVAKWIKESNNWRKFYGIVGIFLTILLLIGYYFGLLGNDINFMT